MRLWLYAMILAALSFSAVCMTAGCSKPSLLRVEHDGVDPPVIYWNDTAALGLYVVSPDAELPGGPTDHVKGGKTYWTVDATTFPSGFSSPVTYGVLPSGGKDSTHDNGGGDGPAPLPDGATYKFGVVAFGGTMNIDESW
jgi:hypothetical protein